MTALRSTRLAILLSGVFSLSGCAGIPAPNTDLCIVNGPNVDRKCYNMATDYNSDGTLKATAVPVYRSNKTVMDLSKALVVDSPTGFEDGLAHLKTWLKELRNHYANCQAGN